MRKRRGTLTSELQLSSRYGHVQNCVFQGQLLKTEQPGRLDWVSRTFSILSLLLGKRGACFGEDERTRSLRRLPQPHLL